jgi:hypothetical protein
MNEVACKPQGPVYRCQAGSDFDKAMFARTPRGRIWTANDRVAIFWCFRRADAAGAEIRVESQLIGNQPLA